MPVAEVVDIGPDWLVTREISGRTAADTWPEDLRPRVVDALAEVTRALHALPIDECPFDRSLATVATEAREAAANGRIDLGDLDHERQGWTAAQLVVALDEQLPDGGGIVIEERSADEVTAFGGLPTAPAGSDAYNPAFDVTPVDLITAVVTERRTISRS